MPEKNSEKRLWRKKEETTHPPEIVGKSESTFQIFFYSDLMEKILFETNLKSMQTSAKPADIKMEELLVFFGINIVMGYHPMKSYKHYWNSGSDLGVEAVKERMSRDKFRAILTHLHLNDNTQYKANLADKLYKVRPVI